MRAPGRNQDRGKVWGIVHIGQWFDSLVGQADVAAEDGVAPGGRNRLTHLAQMPTAFVGDNRSIERVGQRVLQRRRPARQWQ